jgi:hypothetical protein
MEGMMTTEEAKEKYRVAMAAYHKWFGRTPMYCYSERLYEKLSCASPEMPCSAYVLASIGLVVGQILYFIFLSSNQDVSVTINDSYFLLCGLWTGYVLHRIR